MDDPFFPAEIPLMVLHYLVANQCEDAAMKLIEGVPQLKAYVPAKPAHISDALYLKRLMNKSSVNRSDLKKLLWDYASTKILVEEILEDEENISPNIDESLLRKVKILQQKLNSSSHLPPNVQKSPPLRDEKSPVVVKINVSTSTEDYECPKCLASKPTVVPKTDSGCQTEEVTAVQFGLQDEIPIIFYEKLLNDDNLQHKIAHTINEHMQDPLGEQNDRISKISSKTDPEIDKFLVDLLRDNADDTSQSDTGLIQKLGGPISVAHIERDLSSMFDESESLTGNSNTSAGTSQSHFNSDMVPNPQAVCAGLPPQTSGEAGGVTPFVAPSSSKCEEMRMEISPEMSTIDVKKVSDLVTPPGATGTPKRSQRLQCIKRITPTPLTSVPVNPVFNTSVIVEKKTVELGDKSSQMSVIKADVQPSNWHQLGRRPINPKIPAPPRITNNFTILNENRQNEVFKFDEKSRTFSNTKVKVAHVSDSMPAIEDPIKGMSDAASMKQDNACPPSSTHKRKTTPVKLTPEKAKNLEYNFMHYYHETKDKLASSTKSKQSDNGSNKTNMENEMNSCVKKTPMPSSSVLQNQHVHLQDSNKRLVLSNENSQHDVTPMQPPPTHEACSSSIFKTASPNALQRLIASANKVSTTNAAAFNFMNKKKSYSTPRKRKHVRNLSFATPPSLKAATPGSEPVRGGSEGHKRKATDELSVEFRSKKRLNWPDSEKKNASVVGSVNIRRVSDSAVESSLTSEPRVIDQQKPQTSATENALKTAPALSMPTILEESMSNASMSTEEPREVTEMPIPSSFNGQVFHSYQTVPGSSNQMTILTIPTVLSDGTTRLSYFQLSEDMGKLIPISVVSDVTVVGDQEMLSLNADTQAPVLTINQQELNVPVVPPNHSQTSVLSTVASEPSEMPLSHQANAAAANPPLKLPESSSNLISPPPSHSPAKVSPMASVVEVIPVRNSKNANRTCPAENAENHISSLSSSKAIETGEVTNKPKRRSRKERESQTAKPNEPSTSKSPVETVGSSKRSSRSRSVEKKQPNEDECMKNKQPLRNAVPSKPSYLRSDERESLKSQFEEALNEPVKGSKRGRGKGKQAEKPKKPKITMKVNVKELFGDTPRKRIDKGKLPPEVVAAQAVASQAVPLGSPRKSPRRQNLEVDSSMKTVLQKVLPNVHLLNDDFKERVQPNDPVPEPANSSVLQPLPTHTSEKPHQQPENVFNIVPAPLGFPEPTPIKNFAATGCLNISDITCNTNGPLITPFKSFGPPELNETHFTLPPTPRVMMDDNDSNSNSNPGQFLRLTFDSLYPANLLTSTPLKPGIPRTPGRGSSSSNSQSPTHPGKAIGVVQNAVRNQPSQNPPQQQQQAQTSAVIQTQAIVHPIPSKPSVSSKMSTVDVAAVDLSSSKSDGEITSSDDEDSPSTGKKLDKKPQKPLQAVRGHSIGHHQPPALENRTQVSHSSAFDLPKQQLHHQEQYRHYSRPPPLHPRPPSLRSNPCLPPSDPQSHVSSSQNPNLKRTPGINFSVGGREKHLTISEKETLYSLISMGSIAKSNETRKENSSGRPVLIKPTHPMVTPAPQKSNKDEDSVPVHIQSKSLDRLLQAARRKSQASKNT